jgi:hypothetical protein
MVSSFAIPRSYSDEQLLAYIRSVVKYLQDVSQLLVPRAYYGRTIQNLYTEFQERSLLPQSPYSSFVLLRHETPYYEPS